MGLDMYAYSADRAGRKREYWELVQYVDHEEVVPAGVSKPKELAYWRKHPNLHGWMERLAKEKGLEYDTFNGVELELTWDDIDRLERDILAGQVASLGTRGFFFGDASDEHYREQDLQFIREARADLFMGLKVFYNSSW